MPPQNRSKVPIDTILEGKFRVTKEIGRGGMAAVYEAENIDIGKRVAVKILAAELITSRVVRERFIREARAAAAIRSPYICDVYDSGMYDDRPFLVMELLEGESLYDLLTRMRRLSPELTVKITTHTARGLAKAHEANVVHRDLKPENIFLTKNEDGETLAKLLDFGLARFYEPTGGDAAQARLTREGALFGTPAYMSPEQAKGQGEVDHRCDLWALGCIVYECLTGQTVWNVDQGVAMILAQIAGAPIPRPSKLRPDLPPSFDAWFARACDRDPNRRFQSAREFADTLAEALFGPAHAAKSGARAEVPSYLVDSLDALLPPRTDAPTTEPQRTDSTRPAAGAPPALTQPAPVTVAVPEKRSSGRAILLLLVLGALALGAYGLWFYVLHPPGRTATPAATPSGLATLAREPLEKQISLAQEWLSQGKGDAALAALREAYRSNGSGVARSLMSHAGAALEESSGRCRTSGLGRPRPLEATDAASRPALAVSKQGPVVAWVDGRNDPRRRQAFTALLDSSLRRVGDPALVTPEGVSVRLPQLLSTGDGLALVYWEGAGETPGVYVRLLEPNGKIKSPVQRLSATKRSDFYPSMIRNSDGTFWVVWSEQFEPGNEDLVLRKLDRSLTPLTEAVRLTAIGRAGRQATTLDKPDLAVQGTRLLIVFVAEKGAQRQIQLLRLDLGDPALAKGISATKTDTDTRANLGELITLNGTPGKYDQPRIGCSPGECIVVWDEEAVGGYAVLLDAKATTPTWERQFGMKGAHPTLAGSGDKQSVAYYDNSRLKLARITRNGLEAGSTLAKVSGLQPFPSLEPGSEPGQWYISWRDYEAGHLEAFVVRAQCQ